MTLRVNNPITGGAGGASLMIEFIGTSIKPNIVDIVGSLYKINIALVPVSLDIFVRKNAIIGGVEGIGIPGTCRREVGCSLEFVGLATGTVINLTVEEGVYIVGHGGRGGDGRGGNTKTTGVASGDAKNYIAGSDGGTAIRTTVPTIITNYGTIAGGGGGGSGGWNWEYEAYDNPGPSGGGGAGMNFGARGGNHNSQQGALTTGGDGSTGGSLGDGGWTSTPGGNGGNLGKAGTQCLYERKRGSPGKAGVAIEGIDFVTLVNVGVGAVLGSKI